MFFLLIHQLRYGQMHRPEVSGGQPPDYDTGTDTEENEDEASESELDGGDEGARRPASSCRMGRRSRAPWTRTAERPVSGCCRRVAPGTCCFESV
ncbi:hypothetical protein HYH02_005096 [Chlamydomonas schloesseri]|uniref:Uncharacterized protein n=1 Tax=Chlamydomonas schloesseri TaxID=2026947 RepID=A0A835WKW0_9CHLO|nr:hypothetical protein HYH02_005096 [Chlamydomonas schloesseri]|eukprot:KAG2449563.1 hypothetical protein HYH02_005096 [Chlamydomonas schloesseri]